MNKTIAVSSYSPGRVRLRFAPEHEPELNLRSFLEIPAVREISFRKFTGSLLVIYDAKRIDLTELVRSIANKCPDWSFETPTEGEFDKEFPRDLTLGRLFHYVDQFDREIHRRTSGNLDLRTILMLSYVVWGSWEFLRAPVHPRWYDIIKELTGGLRQYRSIYEA